MNIRATPTFSTEVDFTLPKGYLDQTGVLHKRGTMRLATAADEIHPLKDPRVQQNEAYLAVIVLARVITSLGDLASVDTRVVEGLFASDLNFLQRLYERINGSDDTDQPFDLSGLPGMVPDTEQRGFQTVGEA
jgi:hypothetical protein